MSLPIIKTLTQFKRAKAIPQGVSGHLGLSAVFFADGLTVAIISPYLAQLERAWKIMAGSVPLDPSGIQSVAIISPKFLCDPETGKEPA